MRYGKSGLHSYGSGGDDHPGLCGFYLSAIGCLRDGLRAVFDLVRGVADVRGGYSAPGIEHESLICAQYRAAKSKSAEISALARLLRCSEQGIVDVLNDNGFYPAEPDGGWSRETPVRGDLPAPRPAPQPAPREDDPPRRKPPGSWAPGGEMCLVLQHCADRGLTAAETSAELGFSLIYLRRRRGSLASALRERLRPKRRPCLGRIRRSRGRTGGRRAAIRGGVAELERADRDLWQRLGAVKKAIVAGNLGRAGIDVEKAANAQAALHRALRRAGLIGGDP